MHVEMSGLLDFSTRRVLEGSVRKTVGLVWQCCFGLGRASKCALGGWVGQTIGLSWARVSEM